MATKGNSGRPRLRDYYQVYLCDEVSAAFVEKVCSHYTEATLERLALAGAPDLRRAAVLALGLVGSYESNAVLGRALSDPDQTVRFLAENSIRSVWCRAGNDFHRNRLQVIVRMNSREQYREAIQQASQLIEQAPWFAEAWNQRAIAHFHLGRNAESIRDSHQALEINPYHFGAALGMGHCYLRLNKPVVALECFQRALNLNPNLDSIRPLVEKLQRSLKRES